MTTPAAEVPKATEAKEERIILSVDQMLEADDVEFKEIPTWKVKDPRTGQMVQGYTRIGSLSADEVREWRDTAEGPAKKTMGVRLFVDSLVDAEGKRIGTAKHYEAFKKKSNAQQEKVLREILQMNGLRQLNDTQTCPQCKAKFPVQTGGNDEVKND